MSNPYRVLTYKGKNGRPTAGILSNDTVFAAETLLADSKDIDSSTVLGLLGNWEKAQTAIKAALAKAKPADGTPLASVQLEAPILFPGAVFATGANYFDHLEEMAEIAFKATGKRTVIQKVAEPYIIMKMSSHSVIGHNTPIRYPRFSTKLDWEAEIGVVIGKGGEDIPLDKAMESVAGYTIVNDLSARDLMKREGLPFIFDWFGQKCFADAVPMGPWITPAEFIEDPYNMGIKLWVNDKIKQNGNSRQMVYTIAEQISYLSRHVTLRPGDVIATGCPAGVGLPNGDFLKPGDEIKIEVDGIGTLLNKVVAREPLPA